MTQPIRVAILGCGPAGLFAAHAAHLAGTQVTIYSKARKSYMRGAQYLHRPIEGLTGEPFEVEYQLKGSVEGYREKVYGDMGDILVSPSTLVGKAPAWDIRTAYDNAWSLYSNRVVNIDMAGFEDPVKFLSNMESSFDLVISTIPADILCNNKKEHVFRSQKVWATEDLKSLGEFEFDSEETLRDNLVVCSGDPDDWWYRQSRIHGWENTEFPHDKKPNFTGRVHELSKPLSHNCTCNPNIVRMGRYGKWQKGILSHEAFEDTAYEVATLREMRKAS